MTGGPRIAIDAMGGDTGVSAMVAGASKALKRDPSLQLPSTATKRRSASS